MSSRTSGLPGIGDTGSGNSAYISGLVMMDFMMSRRRWISVRCCFWDRPFYLSLLLLGNLCRADWRITTMVLSDSLFISCVFLVSLWREDWRICVLLLLVPSVFSFILVISRYFVSVWLLRYDTGTYWVYFTFCAFLVSSWRAARCVDTKCRRFYLFHCYRLGNSCREACCVDAAVLGNFLLFRCCCLVILWRYDQCVDAVVNVSFLFYFPLNSLALLRPTRPS